jgi:uncharacterized protein
MIRLLEAEVFHARTQPRANAFRYGVFYLLASVDTLSAPRRAGLFSIDRANVFGLRTRDYGDGKTSPAVWIRNVLAEWHLLEADGDIVLMTLPRMLGYAFNPVSFWLCNDRDGRLRAVLAEVRNTFGERHCYLCFHDDHRPIAADTEIAARKVFHVSPFMAMEGEYRFRFSITPERVAISINLLKDGETLLRTSVAGAHVPLTSARLLLAVLRNPLYPLKVIGLIHYQAAKLFLKGLRHFQKPDPPHVEITR